MFKLQVSAFNVNNNYHIFTVNKLTDDNDVMKLICSKKPEEEVFYDPVFLYSIKPENLITIIIYSECLLLILRKKETAEVGTKRKNIEFHNSEIGKKPKVELQDNEDATLNNQTDYKEVMKSTLSKQTEEEVFNYRFSLYSIYC